jgi:lycopene beta-cyclase
LSFLFQLLADPSLQKKHVLIIDREPKDINDKTWCYWSEEELPYPNSHIKDWSLCGIGRDDEYVVRSTGKYKYREIKSLLFYKEIHEKIKQAPNVDFLVAEVLCIKPSLEKSLVETEKFIAEADVIINSIPGLLQTVPGKHFFNQNFKGIRIKTKEPVFDPEVTSLMDFYNSDDLCRSSFFYVLPYSKEEALIEYTRFSSDVISSESYDPYLKRYIRDKYGIEDYEVLETELGVIPMTDFPYIPNPHPRVFQIGTVAGDTKPTTGYTFHFIQQRAKRIVSILNDSSKNLDKQSYSSRFKFYDKLLLSIMVREPERVKDIMFVLFSKVPMPRILKFLDQKTSIWEEVSIFLTLPKLLFISAIFRPKPKLYATPKQTYLDSSVHRAL